MTSRRWAKRWIGQALMIIAAGGSTALADDLAFESSLSPRQLMADQLVHMAKASLAGRIQELPREDQLMRAQTLLDLALELDPEDPYYWKRAAELAQANGDDEGHAAAQRQYLRLAPSDNVARLEWILRKVNQKEKLEERLELLERLLQASSARKQLSAPLRSRLAGHAAAAARELGDQPRLRRWLKEALSLDPANGQAARMIYDLAVEHGASAVHAGVAAIKWVQADPANPAARLELARLLLNEALYDKAADQFEMGIQKVAWAPPPADQLQPWIMTLAAAGDVNAALDLLQAMDEALSARQRAAAPQTETQPADTSPDEPATAMLPAEFELLRLLLLTATKDTDGSAASFGRLRSTLSQQTEEANEEAGRVLAWVAAVAGHDLDSVESWLGQTPRDNPLAIRALGWRALHQSDQDQARQLLEPIAETDPFAALGLARLAGSDPQARAELLASIVRRVPGELAGMLATLELRQMERQVQPTPAGMSLKQLIDRWPNRLWKNDFSRSPWISMKLDIETVQVNYLEPIRARITLRNLAGAPLALGKAKAVPTLLQVDTYPSAGGQKVGKLEPSIYVNLWQRLTLDAGEKLVVDFRLDRSTLGEMVAFNPTRSFTVKTSAILDPRLTPYGRSIPGPLGAKDTIRAIRCWGLPVSAQNLQRWLEGLDSPALTEQIRSIARLLHAAWNLPPDLDANATRTQIADAINQRYGDYDAVLQAWTVRFLNPAETTLVRALQRVADLAQRSDEPLVRIVYLFTQVDEADSPALTAAIRHEDPVIRRFGQATKAMLEAIGQEIQEPETSEPTVEP